MMTPIHMVEKAVEVVGRIAPTEFVVAMLAEFLPYWGLVWWLLNLY